MFSTESQFPLPSWRLTCQLPALMSLEPYPGTNIWFPPWGSTGSWVGAGESYLHKFPLLIALAWRGKNQKDFCVSEWEVELGTEWNSGLAVLKGTCSAREKNTKCPGLVTGGKLVHMDTSAEETGACIVHRWQEVSCTSSKANQKTKQNSILHLRNWKQLKN